MNNLLIKKEQGRLHTSLNNLYNTSNSINVDLLNAEKKSITTKVRCKKITSSKKVVMEQKVEKQIDIISNQCGDLSINTYINRQKDIEIKKAKKKSFFAKHKK